ncbi:MAG: cadherin-like beta sandwich domain-containing protein [Prevotellaceae bacterium]|jgi:hypothetical protein|nr:cadherin-like beta sandwich domain-containing protein [Prevotellaceae bacterium]
MKKMKLLGCSLLSVCFLTGQNLLAQDVDLTHVIVNNDFESIAEGVPVTGTGWKPEETSSASGTYNQGYTEFYGWTCDLAVLAGTSAGINQDFANHNGTYGAWISAVGGKFPTFYEFYQVIDKEFLNAGSTYKVQCLLSGTKMPTSQRLFANQNVQYFKSEGDYLYNQTEGEIATFAAYPDPSLDKNLEEMVVYTTIGEGDSLKIGIRTGCIKGDGSEGGNQWGWFKVDYFRLTEIDPVTAADASLSNITLSAGSLEFSSETYVYEVTLPEGTTAVTPIVTATVQDVKITGAEEVDVTSGSGTSTIVVTALNGTTQKTYTINYTATPSGFERPNAKVVSYDVNKGQLSVTGVEAYTVYNVNGVKAAEVKNNAPAVSVSLTSGAYVVKTKAAGTFKVVVK